MTLQGFQRAFCDLIASPSLVRQVWDDPDSVLARYPLSPRERARLEAISRQPGMATNCALYRMNRVTPLYTYLRLTCHALCDDLRPELDRFWDLQPAHAQFEREVTRFGDFLRRRVREGALAPIVGEVLDLELAVNALRYSHRGEPETRSADGALVLHEDARVVRLSREPLALLAALDAREPLDGVPEGEHYVLVLKSDTSFDVLPVVPDAGRALMAIDAGNGESVPATTVEELVASGLVRDRSPLPAC